VLGEGEEVIGELCECLVEHWSGKRDRAAALAALRRIPGLYVPSFYQPKYRSDGTFAGVTYIGPPPEPRLVKRIAGDLDAHPAESVIHAPETEFEGMHIVEVSRGCPGRCRFCISEPGAE
jgi:radical SAM superfamily enzyme YgiQ (UPF0313 family)